MWTPKIPVILITLSAMLVLPDKRRTDLNVPRSTGPANWIRRDNVRCRSEQSHVPRGEAARRRSEVGMMQNVKHLSAQLQAEAFIQFPKAFLEQSETITGA